MPAFFIEYKGSLWRCLRDMQKEKRGSEGVPQIFRAAFVMYRVCLLKLSNKPLCTNVAGGKKCGTLFWRKMLLS